MGAVHLVVTFRELAQFFPFLNLSATAQVILATIDGNHTALAELEIVAVCAFYDVATLLAFDLIRDNLHTVCYSTGA